MSSGMVWGVQESGERKHLNAETTMCKSLAVEWA